MLWYNCMYLLYKENKTQTCLDKKVFRIAACLSILVLKEEKNQDYFVTPVSYPYFLLIMTTLITFYTVYSFLLNSLYIRIPKVSNFYRINETYMRIILMGQYVRELTIAWR